MSPSKKSPGKGHGARAQALVLWFDELGMADIAMVGGKNASLGEMISKLSDAGILVPEGFAVTARAYREFLVENDLEPRIARALSNLDVNDVAALKRTAREIRGQIAEARLPASTEQAVREAYRRLGDGQNEPAVAVRSSATAEDLPEASFAGQQDTFLNVRGIDNVLKAIRLAYASLFTDRAIAYREKHGFDHLKVAISAGVQRMVRSDLGASGVAFTLDTESGFEQVVLIDASYGLGETVVQGAVNPDEFCVYKPALAAGRPAILYRRLGEKRIKRIYSDEPHPARATRVVEVPEADRRRFALGDADIEELARLAVRIERHYGRAMDIEWAKDGRNGRLYIVQARPETVRSRADRQVVERYRLRSHGAPITTGYSVGHKIGAGTARVLRNVQDGAKLKPGDVLVADMTDPDWGPVMRRAAAIVTNRGGRACHAAIVARELGIPAVVGCGNATERIQDGAEVTVSCAEGATGYVYAGLAKYEVKTLRVSEMPPPPVRIMMNLGDPDQAFQLSMLPGDGVGLARIEFIINRMIGIHPKAALRFAELPPDLQNEIRERMAGYDDPVRYYVGRLAEGIAMLAAAFAPRPVIVRTSDFKSNEYANLLGGKLFEPAEENPMLGLRGAARYIADTFREGFELECRALKRVRDDMGLTNVEIMIPFLRTVEEAQAVTELLAANGLRRGANGLRLIMMCEVPSNALLADKFLDYFDGFSIGSNDLTQLTLGVDRDSAELAGVFDERDPAVRALMRRAIRACRRRGRYIGICGQGPSDHPDFARWLVKQGIDSISLNPDVLVETWLHLAEQGAQPPAD